AQAHLRVLGGHAGRLAEGVTGTPWAFVARHDDAIRPPRAGAPSRGGQPSGGAHQLTVCRNANARINARAFRTSEVVSELLEVVGSPGWARTSDFLINSQALYRLSYRGVMGADAMRTNLTANFSGTCERARSAPSGSCRRIEHRSQPVFDGTSPSRVQINSLLVSIL